MTGKEKYYAKEEELSKVGYLAVLFLRDSMEKDSVKTKELCEKLIKDNLEKHGHAEHFESVCGLVDSEKLRIATKKFAFRGFDMPIVWAKKRAEEKAKKEEKRERERAEVQKRVEEFRKKKYIVKKVSK